MSERILSYYIEKTIAMKEENWASIFSVWRSDSPVKIFNKKIDKTRLKLLTLERIKKSNKKLHRDNRGLTHLAGKTLKIFLDVDRMVTQKAQQRG